MATVTAGELENGLNDLKTHFDNALSRALRRIVKEVNDSHNEMVEVVEVSIGHAVVDLTRNLAMLTEL